MLRTKEQVKQLCSSCPLARTANLIGDSCTLLIVRDLLDGPKRFSDIEKSLEGISTRTLASKLRLLEEKHILSRKECAGDKRCVEYALTEKGERLQSVVSAMRAYGKHYL